MTRAFGVVAAGLCLTLGGFGARAEPSDAEKTLAHELFADGKALMSQGKWELACPKLEESQRLDPGGGTLLNLALCREGEGKTASAYALFLDALAIAKRDKRDDRQRLAQEHLEALTPKLARVKIVVPPAAALEGLSVMLDGAVIAAVAWGTATPVNPGQHRLVIKAPGRRERTANVEAIAASTQVFEVPLLEVDPTAPQPGKAEVPAPVVRAPAPAEPPGRSRAPEIVAFSIAGVAFAATSVFAYQALGARSETEDYKASAGVCKQACVDANERAKSWADAGTAGFIVGSAALITGVVMWFWPASDRERAAVKSVAVAPTLGGATLHVVF